MSIKSQNLEISKRDLTIPIKDIRFDDDKSKSNSRQTVNEMLYISRMKLVDLVKRLNEFYPNEKFTIQNLSNKLFRGGLRDFELAQIANACGFQLQLVYKDIDEPYIDNNLIKGNAKEKYTTTYTKHNGVLVIAGNKADEALNDYKQRCLNVDPLTEIGYAKIIEKRYNVITKFVIDESE